MLIALLSLLVAQSPVANPAGPIVSSPALAGRSAFLELAPASARGMTAACACAAITTAAGDAVTATRGSTGSCTRGGTPVTTGIANGDVVTCGIDQVRVETIGGTPTIRLENGRTNSILQGGDFASGSWAVANGGAPAPGNPTITSNAATAPDGTVTADRVDFPSTTGTGYSVVYNTLGRVSTATSWSHSIYMRGVSGSGTVYLMSVNATATVFNTVACAFVSTSWTRCSVVGTETAATWYTQIGFDLRDGAQSGQGAQSVYIWGAQGEEGTLPTSYIPTTASAAARSPDDFYIAKSIPATSGVCAAATVTVQSLQAFQGSSGLFTPMLSSAAGSAVSPYLWPFTAATGSSLAIDGAGSSGAPTTFNPSLDNPTLTGRYVVGHTGANWFYVVNGVTRVHGSGTTWLSPTYSYVKLTVLTSVISAANWSRVQVDPTYTNCNPL